MKYDDDVDDVLVNDNDDGRSVCCVGVNCPVLFGISTAVRSTKVTLELSLLCLHQRYSLVSDFYSRS
jgi:hypothetical protein